MAEIAKGDLMPQPALHINRTKTVIPTPIEGISEITTDTDVFYRSNNGFLFLGEIYSPEGNSLTAPVIEKIMTKRLSLLPLNKAIKIGSGPIDIIEISDPSCQHCRNLHAYLSSRKDVTRHIFFSVVSGSFGEYFAKRIILNPSEMDSVYSGKLDRSHIHSLNIDPDLLLPHKSAAFAVGAKGVPSLFLNGQYVLGTDIPKIDSIFQRIEKES